MRNDSFGARAADSLQKAWYEGSPWLRLLLPLAWITGAVARGRLRWRRAFGPRPPVSVLVVGNITLGGTGKTPLVVALCQVLARRGLRVGVISRGYGAKPPQVPWQVTVDQHPDKCGDEPLLIARRTGVPVYIDPHRRRALDTLLDRHDVDVVISDDGLQHARLPRSAEIIVLDSRRMLGNGRCLPAGPLREPARRLREVNWIVVNGQPEQDVPDAVVMALDSQDPVHLASGRSLPMEEFVARFPLVQAVAGIGNPDRFFSVLRGLGLHVQEHAFGDHHAFTPGDFDKMGEGVVLMTEKDAVKCAAFAAENFWYLPVEARLPAVFFDAVIETLKRSAK